MIKSGSEDKDTTIYFSFSSGDIQDQIYSLNYNDPVTLALSLEIESFGKLELKKLDDKGQLLDGSTFNVTGPNGYNQDVVVTGGKIVLEKLKKGTYTVKEKKAPKGYLLDTKSYQAEVEPNKTASVTISNEKPTGTFTLKKTNKDGTVKLQGVQYRIWNNNGYDEVHTTNSEGIIKVTGLELGTYNYQEISTVYGYILDSKTYTFELKYANQNTSVVYASATQKNDETTGTFTLKKTNKEGTVKLQGVQYRVWNNSGYDKVHTTNKEGIIEITGLKLGTYNYQEISTVYGYVLDNKIYSFELKYANQNTSVVYASATRTNNETTGTFTLVKYNSNKSAKVQGVKYRVWDNNGYDKVHITDSEGTIKISNLKLGVYYYQEIESADGYLIDDKVYSFSLEYANQNVAVVYANAEKTNDEPTGEITIEKIDKDTGNKNRIDNTSHHGDASINGTAYTLFAKEDIYNVARTIKYFSKDEEVAIFNFNEYGVASIEITNKRTPAKLVIDGSTLKGLPIGIYYSKETKTPVRI